MSTLTDTEFIQAVTAALEQLDQAISDAAARIDIDLEINRNGGLLEIELENRSKIVITSQVPKHEIWVAAKAGGFHFYLDTQQGKWLNTRDDQTELYAMLTQLIAQQSGSAFTFAK
jgi:CyaY protein